MQISGSRLLALIGFDLVIFAIAAFVLVQLMPKPLQPVDYLIVGAVATLLSLLAVWLLLMRESGTRKDVLYKKRARRLDDES